MLDCTSGFPKAAFKYYSGCRRERMFLTQFLPGGSKAEMENLYSGEIVSIDERSETLEGEGVDQRTATVRFSDGSCLLTRAYVRRPPLSEMTSSLVEGFDPETWEPVCDWDDGSTEAWELFERTAAFGLIDRLLAIVRNPSAPKR